jgi:hypothetical protein
MEWFDAGEHEREKGRVGGNTQGKDNFFPVHESASESV